MKIKALWFALLIAFAALNVYVFAADDLVGLVSYLRNLGAWGVLATIDLLIALLIGVWWMWQDARAKGVAPIPYVILTLVTGSLGLLVYLVRHGDVIARRMEAREAA